MTKHLTLLLFIGLAWGQNPCENEQYVKLLKKGYEIQKISVINNLHRHMKNPKANDELFSIILESILSWDENMQKECALSFI